MSFISNKSSRQENERAPTVLVVAAHPIWNVPPFFNVSRELARAGARVLVVGYQSNGLPAREKPAPGVRILRLQLRSRKIRWLGLRRFFAVFEFLYRARQIHLRFKPDILLTFNEPASIMHRITPRPKRTGSRVCWLLEYPELEQQTLSLRGLFALSASCWRHADSIVSPTRERLALHLGLRPECAEHKHFVIHNAALHTPPESPPETISPRAREAIAHLEGGSSRQVRIIYSGAIGNRYAIDSLVRAVGSFPRGVRLLLLGKKHELAEKEVAEAINECAFPDNIRWIDEVPYRELPTILRTADIGFGTYRGDTLNTIFSAPGKLYEYLKASLVVLSDEECCISAELRQAGCGVLFRRPITDEVIRQAIAPVLERPEVLLEMKDSAARLFNERLCMEWQISPLIEDLRRSGHRLRLPRNPVSVEPVKA